MCLGRLVCGLLIIIYLMDFLYFQWGLTQLYPFGFKLGTICG
jgi:hypothetical protein